MREELFGQVEFVVGLVGVEEGDGEGAQGLVVGGFAGFRVLFGFEAPGQVRTSQFRTASGGQPSANVLPQSWGRTGSRGCINPAVTTGGGSVTPAQPDIILSTRHTESSANCS